MRSRGLGGLAILFSVVREIACISVNLTARHLAPAEQHGLQCPVYSTKDAGQEYWEDKWEYLVKLNKRTF